MANWTVGYKAGTGEHLFSSPVWSTMRTIVITLVVRVCVPIYVSIHVTLRYRFSNFISQLSLITEHSYLELGYLGWSSEIPKEHTSGFTLGVGARGQNLGHHYNVIYICVKVFQKSLSI